MATREPLPRAAHPEPVPSCVEGLDLGPDVRIIRARKCDDAGTNSVWFLGGTAGDREVSWILKVADRSAKALRNECAILQRLASSAVPAPEVVRFIDGDPQILLLSRLDGTMLWDLVDDPRFRPLIAGSLPMSPTLAPSRSSTETSTSPTSCVRTAR
jgi:aminoglycoside phosphotransferase